MAGVTLDHITKKYGEVTAVTDLNIQIRDQEFLVLVGPSGCGKSTALRMIAGLEEISGGDLFIGDRRVNDVAPKDRDIAMVFQSYALYPHMSVFDNMAFGLKLRKRPKQEIDRRVKEATELLGLPNLLPRKPKLISENGGQDLYVQTSGLKLKLPEDMRGKVNSQSGREIVFGVRPEHIHSKAEAPNADASRTARVNVSVVEPLGSEVFAYLSANG